MDLKSRTPTSEISTDGFFLVHQRFDGIYVSVFPPVGSGRPVVQGDIRLRLKEFGIEEPDKELLEKLAKQTNGQPRRAADLPPLEVHRDTDLIEKTSIRISEDGMSAFLTFLPIADEKFEESESRIIRTLENAGVTHGAFKSLVHEVAQAGRPVFEMLIAQGALSESGKDGRLEFFFDPDPDTAPLIRSDGTANYKETGMVQNVREGAILIKIIPETSGFPGRRVDGSLQLPEAGTVAPIVRAGAGVKVNRDGRTYVATHDGHVMYHGGILRVVPAFVVQGDIDYETGNIEMKGSISVSGTVRNGFSLKADGDIEIFGAVEAATVITSAGSIWIHGGIAGSGSARIGATRDIVARFIERASVVAGRSVIVEDSILDSQISAKCEVVVERGKGLIIGGTTRAEKRIRARVIGSASGKSTEVRIELIEAPGLYARISELDKVLNALTAEQERLRVLLERYPRDTVGAKEAVSAIGASIEELIMRRKINSAEQREISQRISQGGDGEIQITGKIYDHVLVAFGNKSKCLQREHSDITFYRDEEGIKWK